MTVYRRCALLVAVVAIGACKEAEESPNLPLGHPPVATQGDSAAASVPTIRGEAKVALDSGNALYTAKAYDQALQQYRRAAMLAPREEAPLFGMLMVATATSDTRLSDSVTAVMRKLNPRVAMPAAGDSTLGDVHAGVLPPSHPPISPKKP